ncbi:MAG: DUF1360 domain-containing protein [Actinomycetota bacterium]|nr:DUF1360 domain-containing protein [Actinomycetota bacterium]
MDSPLERLREVAADEQQAYSRGQDRPLGGYLAVMGVYAGTVAALTAAAKLTGRRLPERVTPWEVVLIAGATHKMSRLLTKDPVTSPLRAPFTSYEGVAGDAELAEEVRGHGVRHAIGELLTCPFCLSQWLATGLASGLVFAPRVTRLVAATFAALAGADLLQYVRTYAQQSVD